MKKQISRRKANQLLALGSAGLLINPFNKQPQTSQMHKRIIPSSGEELPVVGLGTWQTFDVGQSEEERAPLKEVLKILVDYGGSVIDSSPMYGRSEEVVGDLTTEVDIKKHIFEATKVWTQGKEAGIEQMLQSMDSMQANRIDLMQIHNLVDWRLHLKTLQEWKEEGKIRYIGITHYHSGAYDQIEQIMKTEQVDFVQINYNLAAYEAEQRILPLAQDRGVAVLINRPFGGGNLWPWTKKKTFPEWAAEFEASSWAQLFLKFVLAHPAVTCVIPGTAKPHHMRDNVQAGLGCLPDREHLDKMKQMMIR